MNRSTASAVRLAPAPHARPRLRSLFKSHLRNGVLQSADRLASFAATLGPAAGLRVTDALRRGPLSRWIDLSEWPQPAYEGVVPYLESRPWVQSLAEDWSREGMVGVDSDGGYETAFRRKFLELCSAACVVLDVGAGRGLYSVLAAASPSVERVYAFEPDPARRFALRLNALRAGRGKIVVDPRAVGAASVSRQVSLDDFLRGLGSGPLVIKLDIEGFELDAVAGLSETLAAVKPILLIEFHQRRLRTQQGRDPDRLVRNLRDAGYSLLYNGHHGALEDGEADLVWRSEAPNDRLTAVLAEPAPAVG